MHFMQMLHQLFGLMGDFRVCGSARSAEQALEDLSESEPDLALIDLSLSGMSGVDLIEKIREKELTTSCVILSGHSEQSYVKDAIERGARGYILKGRPREILTALKQVAKGEIYISPDLD